MWAGVAPRNSPEHEQYSHKSREDLLTCRAYLCASRTAALAVMRQGNQF